ncbi:MAG: SDR family oxidoreductase [Deltaproteobacteria bacterium]|nr:SDR family oxidoreductase [Deltaproteobacteria bacterium]
MATLNGKNVLVIGGSSGIGFATAAGALAAGAKVTIASRSEEKLRNAQALLQAPVEARQIDVADGASVSAFFDASPVYDHIVISGAAFKFGTVRDQDIEEAYAAMNVKFWGAYRVVKKAKVAPDGSFVFVSGFLSRRPKPGMALVGAVNAALETLAQGLALEMAPIRFNVVSPGIVDTPTRAAMPAEARKTMLENIARTLPVKRVGLAEDISDQVLLFLRNTFATGTVVFLDGGGLLV